jgi:GT2 family glycosyltransferase
MEHVIAGMTNAKYYHLPTGGYYQNHNTKHASFAQTAFRSSILPAVKEILDECQTPFIDIDLWAKFGEQGKLFADTDRPLFTSMKGMPGRAGIGGGHKLTMYRNHDNADRAMLKAWCPKDYGAYMDLLTNALKTKTDTGICKKVMVDIIIPTYEKEELTVACFESIKRCTEPGTYRIIWVDNASKNIELAERALIGVDHITVRLAQNVGFVGAVNRGITISNSDYVCLLNNDTVVSSRWLEKLIGAFALDPTLGIVGPVTSPPPDHLPKNYDSHHNIRHIEDHAHRRIFPPYTDLESFNRSIEAQFGNVLADCSFVAFLCAVLKREVVNKVGLLDVNYACGMYDDNDYNLSARKAGFKTKLLYSACIYHRGRSTFDMVQATERLDVPALLRRNRKYLMNKWGLKNA